MCPRHYRLERAGKPLVEERRCPICREDISLRRPNVIYCRAKCSRAAYRKRNAAAVYGRQAEWRQRQKELVAAGDPEAVLRDLLYKMSKRNYHLKKVTGAVHN